MSPFPESHPISALRARRSRPEALRAFFERRVALVSHQMQLSLPEAQREALRITVTLARNRGFTWSLLHEALAGYPELREFLPYVEGKVDVLPDGPPRYAVRSTGTVVRQGQA